jgi:anti-sigma regulatory factor (Ser/Thr protein kinase)
MEADPAAAPALRRRLRKAELTAVGEVRGALRELLRRRSWGGPELEAVAELLTSELVTNALVHTDAGAEVTATVVDDRDRDGATDRLRVEVRDFVARRPRPRRPGGESTHGRGLLLVQTLADAWGVRTQGAGKVVWFELDGGPA